MPNLTDAERDQLAQETAEHIANTLNPQSDRSHALNNVTVAYPDDQRPPRDVPGITAALLAGECWISWADDRVLTALRTLRGDKPAETVDVPRATVLRLLHTISPACPNESEFFKLEGVLLEGVQFDTDAPADAYRMDVAAMRCLHQHPAVAADTDLHAELDRLLGK